MDNTTPVDPQQSGSGKGKKIAIVALLIVVAILIVLAVQRMAPEPVTPPVVTDEPPREEPTAPLPLPAQPISVAGSPITGEIENLLGVIRLHDLHGLPERLQTFLQTIDPGLDPDPLIRQMADAGMDPQRSRPGGNAALFIWKPEPLMSAPQVTALLPLLGQDAEDSALPPYYASFDRYTLFSQEQTGLDMMLPIRSSLLDLTQAPMDGGLAASINVERIWENYGSIAKLYFRTAQGLFGVQLLQQPAIAEQPKTMEFMTQLINTISTTIFDVLDELRDLTFDIKVNRDHLQISLISQAKPNTDLEQFFSGGPLPTPDLLSLLPDHTQAIAISQETIEDWEPMVKILRDILRPAVAELNGAATAQLDDLIKRLPECGRTTIVTAVQPAANESQLDSLVGQYVMLPENPSALHDLLVDQMTDLFETGIYAHFHQLLGVDCQITMETIETDSRVSPIRRFTVTHQPTEAETSVLPQDVLQAMQQTNVFELATVGPYVFLTMDGSVEELAQHVITAAPMTVHPLFSEYEPGMSAVGQVQLQPLLAVMAQEMEAGGQQFPVDWNDTAASAPITYATYQQQGSRITKFRIPTALLAEMKTFADHWNP